MITKLIVVKFSSGSYRVDAMSDKYPRSTLYFAENDEELARKLQISLPSSMYSRAMKKIYTRAGVEVEYEQNA